MADDNNIPRLTFHRGTLILHNFPREPDPICLLWDKRSRQWRAKAMHYNEIVHWLTCNKIQFQNSATRITRLTWKKRLEIELRYYQQEALAAWQRSQYRGTICLPTGAGKSWLALQAIEMIKMSTIVVVPTIDLLQQWFDLLRTVFGPVGILGGGFHDIKDVTVTTYDSACIHMDKYGNRFGLLICDEIHHLPSPTLSHIPEMCIASHRLGLTATYQRPDGLHGKLEQLIGPLVYEKSIIDLRGEHLASYQIIKIPVKLTRRESAEYRHYNGIYRAYIQKHKMRFKGPNLTALLQHSANDPHAREALHARTLARRILFGSDSKIETLELLLKKHVNDRVLIFTFSNELVYRISEYFLIPAITHQTKATERKWILDKFRHGQFTVLLTSRVLNEGIDVPEANVAIILSGSASPIEHVQRLGRILRKRGDKQAVLYELVTSATQESNISYRRRQSDAYR
ncbi:DEAD/DEAH box helicase family protein [candidate division KSB1 bacterium]|nr:DEAD/DEAH box helicase family protein [candidate division KSB1 bacterium]